MALIHVNKTVANTATLLFTLPANNPLTAVQINNRDGQNVYVGDSAITAAVGANGGSSIPAGGSIQIWLNAGDSLYAISAAGTSAGAVSALYSLVSQ